MSREPEAPQQSGPVGDHEHDSEMMPTGGGRLGDSPGPTGGLSLRPAVPFGVVTAVIGMLLLGLVALGRVPSGLPPVSPTPTPLPFDLVLPPSIRELAAQYPAIVELLSDPTIDSVFKSFLVAYEEGGIEGAKALARRRSLLNARDELRVTLVIDLAENTRAVAAEAERHGLTVEGTYANLVEIGVPMSLLVRLAAEQDQISAVFEDLIEIDHILRLKFPIANQPQAYPAAEGQGVNVINAAAWHSAGHTGQGVRLGILDPGFAGHKALLGTELPADITFASFGEVPITETSHGTACAEVAHEIAPDAQMFLARYDGILVSQAEAVAWLLEQGVQIISHSAGSTVGPMDGTGSQAVLVDNVAASGVLWVNSAGNMAESHYRARFRDADGDGRHEYPSARNFIAVRPRARRVDVVLLWDDWTEVQQDYDLVLFDQQGQPIAQSENDQSGLPEQTPYEYVALTDATADSYYIIIQAINTSRDAVFDLFTTGGDVEWPVPEHSIITPADAHHVVSVAATGHADDRLAPYSSRGPTNDGRLKPELAGPTNVSTVSLDRFTGTSAAAPHVAGAAALVWGAYPHLSAQDVEAYLETQALDLGAKGPDIAFGHGRLQMPAPSVALAEPARPIASVPQPTLVPGVHQPETVTRVRSDSTLLRTVMAVLGGGLFIAGAVVTAASVAAARRKSEVPSVRSRDIASGAEELQAPAPAYGMLAGGFGECRLRDGVLVIGRASDCEIRLDDPTVSRHHAQLQCEAGMCVVRDLHSSGGVFVNGLRAVVRVVRPGDRLRLGQTELTYGGIGIENGGGCLISARLEGRGAAREITAAGLSLGRDSSNAVALEDPAASQFHAFIEPTGDGHVIIDMDSTNGTFVNGRRIRVHVLADGDRIRIGETELVYVIDTPVLSR